MPTKPIRMCKLGKIKIVSSIKYRPFAKDVNENVEFKQELDLEESEKSDEVKEIIHLVIKKADFNKKDDDEEPEGGTGGLVN